MIPLRMLMGQVVALQAQTAENLRLATTHSLSKTSTDRRARSTGPMAQRRITGQPFVHGIPYCTTHGFSIYNGLCSGEATS